MVPDDFLDIHKYPHQGSTAMANSPIVISGYTWSFDIQTASLFKDSEHTDRLRVRLAYSPKYEALKVSPAIATSDYEAFNLTLLRDNGKRYRGTLPKQLKILRVRQGVYAPKKGGDPTIFYLMKGKK